MLNVWRSEHIRNLPDAMTSVARRSLAISKRTERERGGESFSLRGLGSLAFHAWNEIRLAIEPTFQHFASSILFKLGWISLNSEWMNSEEKTRQGFVASVVRWSTIHSRVVLLQVMERERKREKKGWNTVQQSDKVISIDNFSLFGCRRRFDEWIAELAFDAGGVN